MLPPPTNSDSWFPRSSRLLVVFALVGLTAWGGMTLTRVSGQTYTIWAANGLLLAVLLKARRRHWPAYLLCGLVATIGANFLMGNRVVIAAGLPLCDTIEVLTAASVLCKFCPRPFDLQQRRTLLAFVLFGVIVA